MYGLIPIYLRHKLASSPAPETAAPGLQKQLMDLWSNYNPTANAGHGALTGAGLGGLLAGGTSLLSGTSSGESGSQRRRRILRDALVGSAFGAGAGYALPTALGAFQTAQDPPSKLDKQVEALSKEFGNDKFLGSPAGAMGLGAITPVVSRLRRGAEVNKLHATNMRGEASNWQNNWLNSRNKFDEWVRTTKDNAWNTVSKQFGAQAKAHGAGVAKVTANNPNPVQAGPAATAFLQKRLDDLLHGQFGTTDLHSMTDRKAQFHAKDLAKLRSDWGNLHLSDGAGGKLSLEALLKQTKANMIATHGANHPQLTNLTNQAFNQELLRRIETDAATTAGTPDLLRNMMRGKSYTGPIARPAMKPMSMKGWAGTAAGLAAPLWLPAAADLGAYTYQRLNDTAR